MRKKITFLFAVVASIIKLNAQVVLNESFTATFVPASAGWVVQNNSIPVGTDSWFQGDPNFFPANSGNPADYFAVNFQSQGSTSGGISNFLITPTVNLVNGAVFKFATRTTTTQAFPDRLQLLMSQGSGTGSIATGTAAVGTFTTLLADINPSLTTTGYPGVWTVYSSTISGVTGTVVGRFAFRYFVSDGGLNGANSDYIGIDDVVYSLPCANPTITTVLQPTTSICAGTTSSLVVSGANSYTWNTGSTSPAISVTPSVTTVYTVTGESTPGCLSSKTITVNVTPLPNLAVNNVTVCAGTAATLIANGATTYSWNTGATTSSIVVTPTANSTYTLMGTNGNCSDTKTVSVTIGNNLSVWITGSVSNTLCSGNSILLTANGANTYSWLPLGSGSSILVTPTANVTYSVAGFSGNCFGGNTIALVVNPTPTISITLSNTLVCTPVSGTTSVLFSGAQTYSSAAFGTTLSAFYFNTPTVTGVYQIDATGTNTTTGCSSTSSVNLTVSLCTGIENNGISNSTSVFPNPFTNELTLSGINGSFEITNALGQVVLTTTVSESHTINTRDFASGIYFVKVVNADNKQAKTIKVIKN